MLEASLPEILLVDDVEENLEVLANLLSTDAWDLAFATSGEEALAQLANHRADLILLDINMPGLDGYGVCKRLKADARTAQIPVIFLTGRTALEDLTRGFAVGAVDYITKPFQREELLARVQTHLELYQARSTIAAQNRDLQHQLTTLEALNAFALVLQQAATETALLDSIGQHLPPLCGADSGQIRFMGARQAGDAAVVAWGDGRFPGAIGPMPGCQSLLPRTTPTPIGVPACSSTLDGTTCVCLPLYHQQELLGVLRLRFAGSRFDQALAHTTADLIAMALYNCRLREELHRQSIHDALTGLYNRRFLDDQLHRELRRAERDNAPVSVLILDLDHFKGINDHFGHPTGDAVLVALARLLGENIRSEDIACRSGGEEFVVVLPRTPATTARERAETLRRAVAALAVGHPPHRLDHVTVSIGVAGFPHHASGADELLRIADQALYRAKRGGRNRVVMANEILVGDPDQAV